MPPKSLEPRIAKLPQWVQRYIAKLEADVEAMKAERGDVAEGNTSIEWRIMPEDRYALPDQAVMRFQTTSGVLAVSLRNGTVYVRALGGDMRITPAHSNAVYIEAGTMGHWS